MPRDSAPIAEFEAATAASEIESLLGSLRPTGMDVVMPKWTARFSLPLVEALEGLGVADAFDAGRADLSGIATGAQLYVSGAWHETYVEVDERGTTAAAATGMGVSLASAPPTFRADRSFLCLIRDRLTGSILFIGRVADPTQAG